MGATHPYARRRGRAGRLGAIGRLGVDAAPDSLEGEITTWVRAHRGALQVAGAVVAGLVLLVADLTWVGLLVILVLLLVFELVVLRWGGGGDGDDSGPPATPDVPASNAA